MASKKRRKAKKQTSPTAKPSKSTRKSFTPEQRAKILAEAKAQKLTGKQVAKKYGISMVTYYVWRKKSGTSRRKVRGKRAGIATSDLRSQLRTEVQTNLRALLPNIVSDEVRAYLNEQFGARRGRKGRT